MRLRKRMKRLSAIVLAAALTVSLLPVTAQATDTDGSITWKSFESSPSYVDAVDTAQEISSTGTEYTASIEEEGGYAYLRFTPEETAYYNFYTTGEEYDVYAYLYNSNWECMAEDDDSADGTNASITAMLEEGTTYYFAIRMADGRESEVGSCGVVVEQISITESSPSYVDAVDTAQEISSTGTEYTASIEEEGGYAYLRFTPAETAYYNVYTTGEYDVYAYLYNSNWECMAEDDDSAGGINASITALLEADTTYYVAIRHANNSETGSCGVVVEQIGDLSGEYDYGTDEDSSGSDNSGSTGGSSGTAAKASQKITIKKTQLKKTIKAKKLKKKSQTFKLKAKTSGDGKITYKKTKGNKKITISKTGKVTVKKGLKKGTYKVKVKITAKATAKYKKASVKKTITIKVK